MDARGAEMSPQQIGYNRYDRLGRLIERGLLRFNWDTNDLINYAQNGELPSHVPTVWKERRKYDLSDDNVYGLNANKEVCSWYNNSDTEVANVIETARSFNAQGAILSQTTARIASDGSAVYRRTTIYRYQK